VGCAVRGCAVARSTEAGSRTLVHAGAAGAETHGMYLSDCRIEESMALVTWTERREAGERLAREVWEAVETIQLCD
jgi:hypothetical protein